MTLPTGVNKQAVIYHIYSGIRFVYCERYSVFSVTNKGSVRYTVCIPWTVYTGFKVRNIVSVRYTPNIYKI